MAQANVLSKLCFVKMYLENLSHLTLSMDPMALHLLAYAMP